MCCPEQVQCQLSQYVNGRGQERASLGTNTVLYIRTWATDLSKTSGQGEIPVVKKNETVSFLLIRIL